MDRLCQPSRCDIFVSWFKRHGSFPPLFCTWRRAGWKAELNHTHGGRRRCQTISFQGAPHLISICEMDRRARPLPLNRCLWWLSRRAGVTVWPVNDFLLHSGRPSEQPTIRRCDPVSDIFPLNICLTISSTYRFDLILKTRSIGSCHHLQIHMNDTITVMEYNPNHLFTCYLLYASPHRWRCTLGLSIIK